MKSIRGVLFDLGGTLLEYRREEVYRALLAEKGLDVPSKAIDEAYRLAEPAWKVYTAKLPVGTILTSEDLAALDKLVLQQLGVQNDVDSIARYIEQNWTRMDKALPQVLVRRAYPDARLCLEELKGLWMRMGIVSNISSTQALDEELELIGLREFFPVRIASGSVGSAKPSSQIFHFAASQLQLNPKQIMFVGDDYDRDYLGSRAAGMNPILIDRKGLHREKRDIASVSSLIKIPNLVWQSESLT